MKKLDTFEFRDDSRAARVTYPEEIWSGEIIELEADDLNVTEQEQLAVRKQAIKAEAKKRGLAVMVNRGKNPDGTKALSLVVQAVELDNPDVVHNGTEYVDAPETAEVVDIGGPKRRKAGGRK